METTKDSITELLISRSNSPLLKAVMDGIQNPIKIHKHAPSHWWYRKQDLKKSKMRVTHSV